MKNLFIASVVGVALGLTSCTDFFETESTHVAYADKNLLSVGSDTIYSMTGILNRLQAIGDRTVLLGEARGDLMTVTDATNSDLRDIALFNVGEDNKYNVPRDYYAIINNCNYYIANADTALKNNRNQYLFRSEFAAAKAIRAWTYLQLVTTYGRVPLVTKPILTKADAEKEYPELDIKGICDYFLHEDGLEAMVDIPVPGYGNVQGADSRLFYIPIYLVLGDMNLWSENYMEAAQCYYKYLTTRNGLNSAYPTGTNRARWAGSTWTEDYTSSYSSYYSPFLDESIGRSTENIFMIAGDSVESEGYYSQLRDIMNSKMTSDDYDYELTPSESLIQLSAAQTFCYISGLVNGEPNILYPPSSLDNYLSGDLRLRFVWNTKERSEYSTGRHYFDQSIYKHLGFRNVHLYRRQMVYLRLAEALNRAGYPRFAYQFLATGVNNRVIKNYVIPEYRADSAKLVQFDFPNTQYVLYTPTESSSDINTQGIHSRGCGFTDYNDYYTFPNDTTITDSIARIKWQMEQVENMIVDEEALELAFEGHRYYDLLRVALRRQATDPNFLANKIAKRDGELNADLASKLSNPSNWFIRWKNLGY